MARLLVALFLVFSHHPVHHNVHDAIRVLESHSSRSEVRCAKRIIFTESRFHPSSRNGKYWGLYQLQGPQPSDPVAQTHNALKYLNHRYGGSWCAAWTFHQRKGWW